MRYFVLILVSAFVLLLAALTVVEVRNNGLDFLGVVSILIVLMFAIGLLGAFRNPPRA
jgi:hypothetical protein